MSEPPPVDTPNARRMRVLIALVMLVPLIALAAYWTSSRWRAKRLARELDEAAVDLIDCVWEARGPHATLADTIAFALPEERPLARCQELSARAHALASELSTVKPVFDRDALDEARRALGDLRGALGVTAGVLATSSPAALEQKLDELRLATCRIAIAEEVAVYPQCVKPRDRSPVAQPPAPRIIVDEQTSWLEHVALSLDARKGSCLAVSLGVVQRDKPRATAYVASSVDAGQRWKVAVLEGEQASLGRPEAPAVSFGATGAPNLFLLAQRDEKGGFAGGTVGRLEPDLTSIRFVSDVPELPEGLEPVRSGSPVLELEGGKLVLALSTHAETGGGLFPLGKEPKLQAVPEGRLVASLAGPPGHVVLAKQEPGAPLSLAVLSPPDEKGRWAKPSFAELGSPELELARGAERLCGSRDKQRSSLLFRAKSSAKLASFAPNGLELELDSFAAPPGGDLLPICGSCEPSLLWRSETTIATLFPGKQGARQVPIDTPVLYSAPKAWRTAASTCTGSVRAVAYIQDGALYVQTARQGAFGRPVLLARPDEQGAPVEVALGALERRLIALWRRAAPRPVRLRVELVSSDDDGATWR